MSNHTPGPWEISKCQCGHPVCKSYFISVTSTDGRCSLGNARLIAAAPEMYEALKTVVSYLESFKDQWQEGEEMLYCEITRALGKTKGDEPRDPKRPDGRGNREDQEV